MKRILLTTLMGLAAYSASAAILVNFDFDRERNGFGGGTMSGAAVLGTAGDTWNSVESTSSYTISSPIALNDAGGFATGITLESTGLNSNWTVGQATASATLDASSVAQTLRYDWSRAASGGTSTFTLSGLPAGQTYDLVLFGGQTGGQYTVGGDTRTITGWGSGAAGTNVTDLTLDSGSDYTIFSGTVDGTGTLSFSVTDINQGGYSDGDGLAGFQLAVAIPEPRTYALLFGALALSFVFWRRRR